MNIQKATRHSWKTKPMPEASIRLQADRMFSQEEYERLQVGRIPKTMEDKWFMYLEDEWLFIHRSWTGDCVYKVRVEQFGSFYKVTEVWMNSLLSQRMQVADSGKNDVLVLLFDLIDKLLLA